jgi:hypothetical protein
VIDHDKAMAAFKRLVASGYARERFTPALYRAMTLSFGFIAHYDLGGFYAARFETADRRVETLEQVLGAPLCRLSPFEVALRQHVLDGGLLDAERRLAASQLEARERAELSRLRVKYGPAGEES